jgi:FixJ family two-component response regulator
LSAVCDSLKLLLEVIGYSAETFLSANAFLSAARQTFDRLILNHHMPQMTGLQLGETLRAEGMSAPILLVTGSLSPDVMARAAALGIRVLEKPPSEEDLLYFIEEAG